MDSTILALKPWMIEERAHHDQNEQNFKHPRTAVSYANVTLAQLTLNDDDDGAPLGGEGSTKPLDQNK